MSTTPPQDTLTAAHAWNAAGASVVPAAANGTKAPAGAWKRAQTERATTEQLHAWFADGHPGLGIILGAVSDDLEMLEFEGRAIDEKVHEAFSEIVNASGLGDVWDAIKRGYCERTPSGGYHLVYRVTGGPVLGNTKLARRPAEDHELDDQERAVLEGKPGKVFIRDLIETRGEGGFVITAPSHGSVHETGLPWELLAGSPATIATITADERDALFAIARMLDEMPRPGDSTPAPVAAAPADAATAFLFGTGPAAAEGGLSPLDDYEQRTQWADILKPHGWQLLLTHGHTSYWRRPGKNIGISATTGHDPARDRLYVFTTSTEFDAETPYTKPGAYALLEHGGDHSAAARELKRRGYGQRPEPRHLAVVPTPAAPIDGTAALQISEPPAHARGTQWPETFTDDGNALLLADTFHDDIRYVPQRGAWLTWDGHRWAWDEAGRTIELGRALVRSLDLTVFGEDKIKAAARKHRNTSLSRNKITAMVGLAQSDARLSVPMTALDSAPRHLNTPGGIVSLADGTMTPSDPAALHTRSTTVAPDPDLPTPRFLAFLEDTFGGDPEMSAFVQRLAGYSASADTGAHVFPFLHGPGGNGKSVLMDMLRHLLGDYAAPAPAGFLMAGRQEHSEELARLQGLRLVVASEINPDARFDEAKLKELTGGDTLTARFMHQSFFEFEPTHHLWLMGNHQPRVKSGGDSFWRRLRLVPFAYKVPEAKKIENLAQLLVDEEGPGILAWMVQGAVDHFARGLREPASVSAATAAYAAEEDHIGRFLEDCCVRGPVAHVKTETGRVRSAYEAWCHAEGEDAMDARTFGRELKARGIARKPSSGKYFYAGLGLLAEGDADEPQGW